MKKRFTTDNGSHEDVCLVDNVTGEEYTDNFEDIVNKMNELAEELAILKSRYMGLGETSLARMGGFSIERDGRGRYNILSENIIPKNSSVVYIKSPDTRWNKFVAEILWDIIERTKKEGN